MIDVDTFIAAFERDTDEVLSLFRTMSSADLQRLRVAHVLDQAQATRPVSVAFGGSRIALIDFVLKERALRDGG